MGGWWGGGEQKGGKISTPEPHDCGDDDVEPVDDEVGEPRVERGMFSVEKGRVEVGEVWGFGGDVWGLALCIICARVRVYLSSAREAAPQAAEPAELAQQQVIARHMFETLSLH